MAVDRLMRCSEGARWLLVEDDRHVRRGIGRVLDCLDVDWESVATATDALGAIGEDSFDLVVTNLFLRGPM